MKRVLFICTKNSARSQMAEALVNHDLTGRLRPFELELILLKFTLWPLPQ